MDRWKAETDARKPLIEAGARYAELAIRSLLIVSGGAALALIGFAGSALKDNTTLVGMRELASSVRYFSLAAAGSVAVAGLSYLSQAIMLDAAEPWNARIGGIVRLLAILMFVASLACFLVGAFAASSAFEK